MAYIGQSLTEGTRRAYTFTATASQTTFNAVYGVGAVDVYQNGILLQPADYTATTGTTVVLGVGAAVNDEITIIAHNTFSVADTVSASQGGTFVGNVAMSGTLDVTGVTTLSNDIDLNGNDLILDADGDSKIEASTDDTITVHTAGSEAMRIDSAQTAGFGVSPSLWRNNFGDKQIDIGAHTAIYSEAGNTSYLANNWYRNASNTLIYKNTAPASYVSLANDNIIFANAASGTAGNAITFTERMRILNSGHIQIQDNPTTSPYEGAIFENLSNGVRLNIGRSTNAVVVGFYNNNGFVGSISTSGSSTAYNTSSDYRLKENVTDVTDGITRVKQLAPKRFNFIADTDTTVDGFLAHEAQAVVPEAVTGTHNGVEVWAEGEELPDGVSVGDNKLDDDGNTIPVYQGIDQSKLVPLLTAALQEAIAKIETLETENTAIKARLDALDNVAWPSQPT